jgi:hypothetical protein
LNAVKFSLGFPWGSRATRLWPDIVGSPTTQLIIDRWSEPLTSGARGREFESPRSDQFNQRLGFELGTLGDVFGDVFISKKISLHTFTKRVAGEELTIFLFIEPRTLDVEQLQACGRAA